MNKPISLREKEAWDFAVNAHKGQVRKFSNKPYFTEHVQKVNGILKKYTKDEDLLIAALLHDVPEDCYEDKEVGLHVIEEKFGKRVASIVKELTSSEHEIEWDYSGSKTNYLIDKMISMSDDALLVKLSDRLQNISDAFTASEKFRNNYFKETSTIVSELEKLRKFNKMQLVLLNDIKSKLGNIESIFKLKRFKEM